MEGCHTQSYKKVKKNKTNKTMAAANKETKQLHKQNTDMIGLSSHIQGTVSLFTFIIGSKNKQGLE